MNIILLGAPGAGKGTQAAIAAAKYNIPHISTGDIFRQNIKDGTPLGVKAKEYMENGLLVPDELVIDLVATRLRQSDCAKGCFLDGFPRTVAQAQALDKVINIGKALNFVADHEIIMKRTTGRRICSKCGAIHHIGVWRDSKCSKCQGELIHRNDDKEEVVAKRLVIYNEQTAPLIEYYQKQGKLVNIDAIRSIEAVSGQIAAALKQ